MPDLTGIIDSLSTPPLGLLQPVLDVGGPYATGDYTLSTFQSLGAPLLTNGTHNVHDTFGVITRPNGAIPLAWGYSIGYDSHGANGFEGYVYYNRFCQLVPQHELLSGFFLPLQVYDVHRITDYMLWPMRLLGSDRLGLHVSPGVSMDLFYLCLL